MNEIIWPGCYLVVLDSYGRDIGDGYSHILIVFHQCIEVEVGNIHHFGIQCQNCAANQTFAVARSAVLVLMSPG